MSVDTAFAGSADVVQEIAGEPPATVLVDRGEDTSVTSPIIAATSLMDLPFEVREMVWHLALENERHVPMMLHGASKTTYRYFDDLVSLQGYRRHKYRDNPPFLPAICRISSYTRAETIQTFLRSTTFGSSSIADNDCLTGFLASVPGGFTSICGLYFDCFALPGVVPQKMDLDLAARCTSLRELKLLMHNQVLFSHSAQTVWMDYNFSRLLDCRSVENVSIIIISNYRTTAQDQAAADQAARDLAYRIESGFGNRSRTVQVTVD